MSIIRALTICQPYAELIRLGEKRVENRTWPTSYRGRLAIHAGKGTSYLEPGDRQRYPGMAFGAVVAVANLVGCVRLNHARVSLSGMVVNGVAIPPLTREQWSVPTSANASWPWLETHEHTEGPVCWILEDARALRQPVPCSGHRSLWGLPPDLLAAVEAQLK